MLKLQSSIIFHLKETNTLFNSNFTQLIVVYLLTKFGRSDIIFCVNVTFIFYTTKEAQKCHIMITKNKQ